MYQLSDIRKLFLDYFIKNNHELVKSYSLLPHNDNSLLFTNSGMVQFKNVFLGLEQKPFKTATTAQKCLRAGGKHNDLDNVGYTARHHTFFEMLGNFSFGDYFKEQAIFYAYDLIHNILGIPKDKLLVTVYHNDDEAANLWKKIAKFDDSKIIRIPTSDNFWSMGDVGPCGPCTEIFYDYGSSIKGGPPGSPEQDGDRFVEIWNLVFMQYNQLANGEQLKIAKPSIDTGMGLERITSVLQGVTDNYDIDIFKNIIDNIENLIKVKVTQQNKPSFKVIADHMRAAVFMISDGILPSNEGRGYVLRRIIRRAIRHGYLLNNKQPIFYNLVPVINNLMGEAYPEIKLAETLIINTLKSEEEKFGNTVVDGMKLLDESMSLVNNKIFPGEIAFKLYDTFGFPLDLTEDILRQSNIKVNVTEFNSYMQKQKEQSKKAWLGSGEIKDNEYWFNLANQLETKFIGYETLSGTSKPLKIVNQNLVEQSNLSAGEEGFLLLEETPFYAESGGQVGDIGIIKASGLEVEVLDTQKFAAKLIVHKIKVINGSLNLNQTLELLVNQQLRKQAAANHTATHLLFAAISKVMGVSVSQQGSLVTPYRLRSDIYINQPLSKQDIINIEHEVNSIILQNLPISVSFMPYEQAIESGAKFLLGEKYPEIVRVVRIGDEVQYSTELCGGTHVKYTGEIGILKILSESGIKAGVRRIEATTNLGVLNYMQDLENKLNDIYANANANSSSILVKINNLISENKSLKNEVMNLRNKSLLNSLEDNLQNINGVNFITLAVEQIVLNDLKDLQMNALNKFKPALLLFVNHQTNPDSFLISIDSEESKLNLTELLNNLKNSLQAKGGGNKSLIQGKLTNGNTEQLKQTIANWLNS
ncbi:alanine--tRNA ligase [Rickettsiales bacterium LUAb2]